jgi:hypothetical protein
VRPQKRRKGTAGASSKCRSVTLTIASELSICLVLSAPDLPISRYL